MAGKLARIVYRLLRFGQESIDKGTEFYEQKYRNLQIQILKKKSRETRLQVIASA